MKQIPDKSVDFVITDPPYGVNKKGITNDNSLEMYHRAIPEIFRILKKDSWFVTYFPIRYLPDMFKDNPFEYVWLGTVYYINIAKLLHAPLGCTKQSNFLIFKKGKPKRKKFVTDIYQFKKISGEKMIGHPAPKPLHPIKRMIEACSKEGDLILDPFIGSGTTAIACKEVNRNFMGIEIESKYVDIARKRIREEVN